MASVNAIFHQADLNNDQRLDINEFSNLAGAGGLSGASYGASSYGAAADLSGLGAAGGYGSSSYQASSYESSSNGGALGGNLAYAGAGYGDAGYGASSYESSAYNASLGGGYAAGSADLSAANYTASSQSTAVQQYATDAQGLFQDSNPQIIRRPAPGGNLTYTQNIRVRFLQPPPVPPPGPLIIKEVRPPQPPPPPPLRIRQQAPSLPQPPPLVLRERPPVAPASVASQTVVRRLAALPVPPRSVIIERLPAAPPRPRDIIIERWVPYGAQAKRRTIVQRAAAAQQYAQPRNVIIQYEAPQVRIVRQFQRLGVTQENPAVYVQRYGASLLEAQVLLQQARAAGVIEDISPPAVAGSFSASSSQFASSGGLGFEAAGSVAGFDAGVAGLGGGSSYESSSYSASTDVSGLGAGVGGVGYGAAGLGGAGAFESSSYSSSTGAAFGAADTNLDGVLSQGEFAAAGY